MAAEVKPNSSVSHAIRCSVAAPTTSSPTLTILAVAREAAQDFADAGVETNAAKHEKENRSCVEPMVEKITEEAAHNDARDKDEWQFHGISSQAAIAMEIPFVLVSGVVVGGF